MCYSECAYSVTHYALPAQVFPHSPHILHNPNSCYHARSLPNLLMWKLPDPLPKNTSMRLCFRGSARNRYRRGQIKDLDGARIEHGYPPAGGRESHIAARIERRAG